ncbi:sugar kinase [Simiduia agarivorans]|uniref:Ribokinase-like domain-containing protein n=1 Tax=Simiduia agarivorans (strain DSM 21679 / JCM 13881 / BCRC 17597 / SA1) TaxID=1117647 RepID=K4KQG6_SIMAS|nr:sugar kinase [Simiduia agarivorans]AFV00511.1 ribokinase-like domain-containing protein [Simiduia agarivorans SA1 = DSM 21679]
MNDFVIMGECLIELAWDEKGNINQGFAGDVYSVAAYLKRANPSARARLLCAIGQDALSQALVSSLESETVETSLLLPHPQRHLGLYAINNDAKGERTFMYWRSESAARQTLSLLDAATLLQAPPAVFYFTGISLAILEPDSRLAFWQLVESLISAGTRIVFDSNYRARLWAHKDEAKGQYERAFTSAHMILPGVDDFEALYDLQSGEAVAEFLSQFDVETLVIKNGPGEILYGQPQALERFPVTPVAQVIDTTAAGDSFAGTLLAQLSKGDALVDAIARAAFIAGRVIGHKGAILPANLYPAD